MAGAVAWISVSAFTVMNIAAATRWQDPGYSVRRNFISSLGTTECLTQAGKFVCSPWHLAADVTWIAVGLLIAAGAYLLRRAFPANRLSRAGLLLLLVNGIGLVIVGANPDNLRPAVHFFGGAVGGLAGVLGALVLGLALRRDRFWRAYGYAAIVIAFLSGVGAALMQVSTNWVGLFESLLAYPVMWWMTAAGIRVLLSARRQCPDIPTTPAPKLRGRTR
ncbi:DUF998 domain-containing protein [Rhodococcus sp. NPDC056960]|uniref:DUF998 domain-containing protein n=1 Tax=Rhodococcus sp. NPDC056960 TaxID=3345982 RepID=UPI003642AC95